MAPFSLVDLHRVIAGKRGDAAASAIASAQEGLVTTDQLRYIGLSQRAIRHRLEQDRLHREHRGVFLVGHRARTELTTFAAAILAVGPSSYLSHWAAAWLWQMMEDLPGIVDVSLLEGGARSRPGICVHRTRRLHRGELRTRRGLPVLSPAATLLDLADLGNPVVVERALNEARERKYVSQGELRRVIDRSPGRAGLRILAGFLEDQVNDDFSRKEGERILWRLIKRAELPTPRRNLRAHGYELDFYWPDLRLNVETDGHRWHSARNRVNSDRARDADLAANGIQVMRFTWDQLQNPEFVVARLSAAIALASERRRLTLISPPSSSA